MRRIAGMAMLLVLVPPVARASCTISAAPVNFGTYVPTSAAPTDSTGTVTVTCTSVGSYTIALSAGTHGGGASRAMGQGANALLNYDLYQDAARTIRWTDLTGGGVFGQCSGRCTNNYTVYGRIPSRQSPSPGAYSDVVLALLNVNGTGTNSTAPITANAVVQASCQISATSLDFGTYIGVRSDATSTISVTCTNATPYTIGLSAGASTGATTASRRMTGPAGSTLAYALFQDSARTVNWGNTSGTDTRSGSGNGVAQALTVYGRIAAGQYDPPGAYSDIIVATVTY